MDYFQKNPKLYLYEHIASSGPIGDILENLKNKGTESENIDNYNQTARNIQEVANKIYDVLHQKHNVGKPDGISTNELRIKAENAFNGLEIDTQWFYGNEADFNDPSDEEIIRAAAGPVATDSGTTGTTLEEQLAAAQQQFRNTSPRNVSQRRELSTKIDEIKGKILSFKNL